MTQTSGNLFVLSAPSGAGKSSLLGGLLQRDPGLRVVVSHTTRAPRPGEQDGEHYHFVDQARFARMIADGEFLEHARVFDHFYGTAEAAVREPLAAGGDLVLEIDWQGARQVRQRFPDACGVFVLPPSVSALQHRLAARRQDSAEVIARRMRDAAAEMSHYREYDYLVVNDDFDQAVDDLASIVKARRLLRSCQEPRLQETLRALLAADA
jgi:guanylate kinase